ncbi:MAG: 50S ribosomal protein L23 [Candidatus Gottesmanbacteria bacterium GW2011_GWA2_44_17]|uniref:Large ribosomal subunit protein uL23 n=3 Tax=Candidatus Gottesmaniibacteriota TaxID=1752720 RepID=A0A0G1IQD6_9BACT|nr:MAG: 50S ribosomal protein L23 [Microgenomates group bacterium GW2011_GWC1_43_11]KKT38653.1 MAG: 50S ribosomal protein L23 [Candidatus Gottesmanbacteria bacterium GW2011_GWB1_44_11c]KKT47348.1 MAG: 50S ribosomal protein L23 [Candidatus Gottesmanbacteria bacterium GW2011_GWA2_44_17]KKT61148.1 MAG: 50S ribosomal protein L23 [Candidatus Gottesmanbacteria bacterium GW2011_GWA1_44_24b]HCM82408.1 50S ribosomal protein L23 [Patescibacteria group bacterium]
MKTYIVKPLITEKTMHMSQGGWYTFRSDVSANKNSVRKEIEKLYSVSVEKVRSGLMHGKVQRVGRKGKTAKKSDWKKICVKLKAGQTIDAFQIGGQEEKK